MLGNQLRNLGTMEKFTGDDPFVVLLGDTIYRSKSNLTTTSQMLEAYAKEKKSMVMLEKVLEDKVRDYGIISGSRRTDLVWDIDDVIEKPEPEEAPSLMGITGTYILHPDIYPLIKKLEKGKNGEYQLSDALKALAKQEKLVGYEISGERFDIGTKELWVKTFIEFARRDRRFKDLI